MAKLVAVTQELAGLSHELGVGWTTLGRADGNGFKLPDSSVSGQHCEVRSRGDELEVRDLCSTNGTFVQGRKITEALLKAGQTLRVGEVLLRFEASPPARELISAPGTTSFVNTMLVRKGLPSAREVIAPTPDPGSTPATSWAKPTAESVKSGAPSAAKKSKKQHQVLFVDDSLAFIETFTELCSVFAREAWRIHCATSADQALSILQKIPVDLVVLDVVMPMVDGIQLLGIIKRRFPAVRAAILTGKSTESHRSGSLANGAELYIEKPLSADGGKIIFNMLQDLVSWESPEGFCGTLHQVGLPEVIQMQCIGRRSLILEVRNHQVLGEIHIEIGSIIHAAVGDLVGPQAINQLLSLPGGEFRVKPFEAPPQRTVDAPWEFLLMEAARCCDEDTALLRRDAADSETASKPVVPAREVSAPTPDPGSAPAISRAEAPTAAPAQSTVAEKEFSEPDDEFVVVATYDGQWSSVDGTQN